MEDNTIVLDGNDDAPEMSFDDSQDSSGGSFWDNEDHQIWAIIIGLVVLIAIIVGVNIWLRKRAAKRQINSYLDSNDSFDGGYNSNVTMINGLMVDKNTGRPLTKEEIERVTEENKKLLERNSPEGRIKLIKSKMFNEYNAERTDDINAKKTYLISNIEKNKELHLKEYQKKINKMRSIIRKSNPVMANTPLDLGKEPKGADIEKIKSFINKVGSADLDFMIMMSIEGMTSQILANGKTDKLKKILGARALLYGIKDARVNEIIDGVKTDKEKETQIFVVGLMATSPNHLIEVSKYQEDIYNAFI